MKYKTAIILCGGKGTRLGSIAKKLPKTLVKIQNKEILWYIINFLKSKKFNHFILPLGYKSNLIKKYIKKNNSFGTNIDLINTGINTNIGKRIYKVIKQIRSEHLIILNGDAIFNFDIKKIFNKHMKENYDATFLSAESKYQFGTVCIKKNKVVDFKRNIIFDSVNVRNNNLIKAFNYAGLLIIKRQKLLKHSKIFLNCPNFEKDFYPLLIKKYKTGLKQIFGLFHSIDNIKDIIIANKKSKDKSYKSILKLKKKLKNEIIKTN